MLDARIVQLKAHASIWWYRHIVGVLR